MSRKQGQKVQDVEKTPNIDPWELTVPNQLRNFSNCHGSLLFLFPKHLQGEKYSP